MVAFDVAGGREAGLRFITALRLAAMAPSLGGVETLVLHPASTSHRQLDAAGLSAAGIGEGSIRVSAGGWNTPRTCGRISSRPSPPSRPDQPPGHQDAAAARGGAQHRATVAARFR